MGKKNKYNQPQEETPAPSQNDASSDRDIFKTLFGGGGGAPDPAAASIFSDSNPFRRKAQDPSLSSNQSNAQTQSPDFDAELKRTKGENEKSRNLDQDSGEKDEEIAKKPKKIGEHPNLGSDKKVERRRRKRKRDELEREYEAKRYGAVAEDAEEEPVAVGRKRKKAENAVVDMLVSKEEAAEGFDDESKLLRTVFIGNLPLKLKKKGIVKEFSLFGEIESVRIRSVAVADPKIPKKAAACLKKINDKSDSVHAYIVYKTEQSAEASLAHNMAVVGGNHIRVDRACPPRKKLKGEGTSLYDNKRTVFVGNLPLDVKDEEIYQLFSGIKGLESSIEGIRVIRDPNTGCGKGIAYVLLKTTEAVGLVVRRRNLRLRDRELRLSPARQDSTPSKRRNPFPAATANSPTKKLAVGSRTPDRDRGSKPNISYQGLRATQSGVQKKVNPKHSGPVMMKSKSQKGERHDGKRPAVAARKAKAKALKEVGSSQIAGKKRKLDSRTPESINRKKKFKKFK